MKPRLKLPSCSDFSFDSAIIAAHSQPGLSLAGSPCRAINDVTGVRIGIEGYIRYFATVLAGIAGICRAGSSRTVGTWNPDCMLPARYCPVYTDPSSTCSRAVLEGPIIPDNFTIIYTNPLWISAQAQ